MQVFAEMRRVGRYYRPIPHHVERLSQTTSSIYAFLADIGGECMSVSSGELVAHLFVNGEQLRIRIILVTEWARDGRGHLITRRNSVYELPKITTNAFVERDRLKTVECCHGSIEFLKDNIQRRLRKISSCRVQCGSLRKRYPLPENKRQHLADTEAEIQRLLEVNEKEVRFH